MNTRHGTSEEDNGRIWCVYAIMAVNTVAVSWLVFNYLGVLVLLFWLLAWFFFKWLDLDRIMPMHHAWDSLLRAYPPDRVVRRRRMSD